MAIAENGPGGHHKGRLGNIVYYVLNGKNISREIGISTKPFTQAQLKQNMLTKLRSQLFHDLLDFINIGFGLEAIEHLDNGFNRAIKNNPAIVTGTYPNLEIAYDQILLSKGTLDQVQNWEVTQTGAGLQYHWKPARIWPGRMQLTR